MATRKAEPWRDGAPPGWPPSWWTALADAALERASSAAVFQRGQSYAAAGAVRVLGEDALPEPALRAQVVGSQVYATELRIEDDSIAGDCDCPHALDGWFCKHQVAVGLVWRGRLHQSAAGSAGPGPGAAAAAPGPAGGGKGRERALRDFLCSQEPAALADKMLELARHDRDIARELRQWQRLSDAKHEPVHVVPLISEILSVARDFLAWDEVSAYARRAQAVLPLLRQAGLSEPGAAVDLCVHALRRTWIALEQADDSSGEIGGICEAIGAELARAVRAAGPRPAAFGDTYLQLQVDAPLDCFDTAAVEAAMGEVALRRYRQILEQRWREAKDAVLACRSERAADMAARKRRTPAHEAPGKLQWQLSTLESLHLAQLEQRGADEAMLAILREDLSQAQAHSRVVEFLEARGRFNEALEQSTSALAAFPDDWRLQEGLLRCYEREGMHCEALALLRRQFEAQPSVQCYHRVLSTGRAAGEDADALRSAMFDILRSLEQECPARLPWARPGPRRSSSPPDVTLRAEILGSEGRWLEACKLVQSPSECRDSVLHRIATHLPDAHGEQAAALLLRVFEEVMQRSTSPYREALALVKEIGQRTGAARHAAWLQQLRGQYKAKRNFIRDLPPD
jgi:tetratricopeptide (TPR) repeat protein